MIERLLALLLFCVVSTSVFAQRYVPVVSTGTVLNPSMLSSPASNPYAAAAQLCSSFIAEPFYVARSYNGYDISLDWNFRLFMQNFDNGAGNSANISCGAVSSSDGSVISSEVKGTGRVVSVNADCTAGQEAVLTHYSEILSFRPDGTIVQAGSLRGRQCNADSCVVQMYTPTANFTPQGTLYSDPYAERVVGTEVIAAYLSKPSIGQYVRTNGEYCNLNIPGFGVNDVYPVEELPDWWEFVRDGGAQDEGGSSSGGGLTQSQEQTVQAIKEDTTVVRSDTADIRSSLSALSGRASGYNSVNVAMHDDTHSRLNGLGSQLGTLQESVDGLRGQVAALATGTGDGGGIIDGPSSLGDIPLNIEHPDGGFKAPGETHEGFSSLLNPTASSRPSGQCPTWSMDVSYFERTYFIDAHCDLWQENSGALAVVFSMIWAAAALRVVLSA
jgi:hypothetical protein